VIEFHNVSKGFSTQPVLRDLDVIVHPGETLAIIGESGCGKSVMMKLMMSLLTPDVGDIHWFGNSIVGKSERKLRQDRLRFGYLFQGAALFDSLTVAENVAFGLRQNTDLDEDRIRQLVLERLREVGLSDNICRKKPAELSGGMKKRVGLARAMALTPDVMFYDEPTTGLDPIMSDVINELILRTRARRPVTSVVVTHDMHTVRKVADRVVILYPLSQLAEGESQIIFEGTAEEAFASDDSRVLQFVRGEAGERINELAIA
jgi:phospholipid/cholesterol/gamma-HCH transport system ATP-binding protein